MEKIKYVIRKCVNSENYTIWMALYKNGIKQMETYSFNPSNLTYLTDNNHTIDVFIENDEQYIMLNIDTYFPEIEDFSYLLDMRDISIGSYVYLPTGVFRVNKTWESRRDEGVYDLVIWEKIGNELYSTTIKNEYASHNVLMFRVNSSDEDYICEDYNYKQGNLMNYLISQQNRSK